VSLAHIAIAARDLRGSWRAFILFFACLALGVATITAVGSVNRSVVEAVERDARILFGSDVEIEQPNRPLPDDELAELVPEGATVAALVRTNAMARGPEGTRLPIEVKAVDDAYPLYGAVGLEGVASLEAGLADQGVVVERALLDRLGVAIGDRLGIGEGEVRITGILTGEPDRLGGYFAIGPRVMMARTTLEALEVIRPGAIARYEYRLRLPEGLESAAVVERLSEENPDAAWRARGSSEVQPRIARFTDRLAIYLTLAGLTALLIGGLGIALAVHAHLGGKTTTIATLKCLGARSRDVALIYGAQILLLTLCGAGLGVLLGQLMPFVLLGLIEPFLPVGLAYVFHPAPAAAGLVAGILAAALFTLWPLARARDVSPAQLFRDLVAPAGGLPRLGDLALLAGCALALMAFVVASVDRSMTAIVFIGAVAGSAVVLALLARLLIGLVAPLARFGATAGRLAMVNLRRPGSGAPSVVIAVGAGLAVLTMMALIQHNLVREVRGGLPDRAAQAFFIDIQPDQRATFVRLIEEMAGGEVLQLAPMMRARVVRIDGVPVDEAEITGSRWTIRRDRGLSFYAEKPPEAEITQGAWWPADYDGPPLVSVEDEVARDYGVGIGDTLSFNILGRVIEAEIANLRKEIDWGQGRLGFIFILDPNTVAGAPHTIVASADFPPGEESALFGRLGEALPNVTPISIGSVVDTIEGVLEQIALAINVVAVITLVSGVLVLAAAVNAARRQQIRQSVLLKIVGARRADLLRLLLTEYALIGLAAALAGVVLGTAGSYAVIVWVMDFSWRFAPWVAVAIPALALFLTFLVGGIGLKRVLDVPAAAILRQP